MEIPMLAPDVQVGNIGKATSGMTLRRLKQCHPRLNLERVKTLQALYRGGQHLLGNEAILTRIFPKYTYELMTVYKDRCARAFYENIFALVINQISAGLAQDPCRILPETETVTKSSDEEAKLLLAGAEAELSELEGDEFEPDLEEEDDDDEEVDPEETLDENEEDAEPEEDEAPVQEDVIKEKEVDPYWEELMENATALSDDGSNYKTFDQVIRDCAVEALVTGWAWLQADLPREDEEAPPPTSFAEQEEAGGLRAYLIPWSTDAVTDWEERNGRLLWVRTYTCEIPAEDPTMPRDTKIHCWTIWTRDAWTKYQIEERKGQTLPSDETVIPIATQGKHTFGRVPWTRLDVSNYGGAHLHIGDIIESLCRNYFNRTNGESFQWTQYYYQQLYEFLGPEVAGIDTVVSDAQTDSNRAKRRRAPGEVHVRGADDRAEFIGPDMGGAEVGRNALQDLRDAILRVVAQMALAQDTSGAMLRRSADSKRQDSVAQEIVLGAIGKRLVTMANHVAILLATGRGDPEAPPKMVGYEHFNVSDTASIIDMDVLLEGVDIPSATFQIERKYDLAIQRLGDNASAEVKSKIKEELCEAITQDQLTAPPPLPPGFADKPFGEEDPNADPDAEVEPEAEEEPIPPKKPGLPKSKKGNPLFDKSARKK